MKLEFWLSKAFSPHLNIHIMAKMVISYISMDILAPFWKAPYFKNMLYVIASYCLFHTNLISKHHKAFAHHFNVQIMAKIVVFHLFQDILAAILKGALYLEFSRILKICDMLLLLAVHCIQIWFLTSKSIFSSF